jgi:hypothetical protein
MPIKRRQLGTNTFERDLTRIRAGINLTEGTGATGDHGLLVGLGDDDHPHYMHNTVARTVTAQHSFSPASPQAPFVLGANAQGQLVTGLNADELDSLDSSNNPGATAAILKTSASGYLLLARLGAGSIAPTVPLHSQSTTEPLRIQYDTNNYASFAVSSGGNLTVTPIGDFIFAPGGNDINPNTTYQLNIGSQQAKYLTLHAAELWVQTLVAEEVAATMGGRLLVGPTTKLAEDLSSGGTTIYTEHNNLASGDVIHLEAWAQVEFMSVTSSYTEQFLTNSLANSNFETLGAGDPDFFGTWVEDEDGGNTTIHVETTIKHLGSNSVGLTTSAAGSAGGVSQDVTVEPGERIKLIIWAYGDGTRSGEFSVYDNTNTTNIITRQSCNATAAAWVEKNYWFTAPGGCESIKISLLDDEAATTGVCYFDDVTLHRSEGKYSYTVTRNLDGTGANSWWAGDAVFNTGSTGNSFMDIYSQHSINGAMFDNIFTYDAAGLEFGDNLNDKKSFELFPGTDTVGNALYIGYSKNDWSNVYFNIGTAAVITGGTFSWQYWNGAIWTDFTPTTSVDFETAGEQALTFTGSSLSTWGTTTVNGISRYWIRYYQKVSATTWTTTPRQEYRRIYGISANWGPTIVGNVRQSATYNDWEERWVIGNLNGFYGVGTTEYGAGFGDPNADHMLATESQLKIVAASGEVSIDASGIVLAAEDTTTDGGFQPNSIDWLQGSTEVASIWSYYSSNPLFGAKIRMEIDSALSTGKAPGVHVTSFPALTSVFLTADVITLDGDAKTLNNNFEVQGELTVDDMIWVNESANVKMTNGITINQAGNDDEIISLKSSTDIAHGLTSITETDTYAMFKKAHATEGGLNLTAINTNERALILLGIAKTPDTTHSTAGVGICQVRSYDDNGGTSTDNPAANANLFTVNGAGVCKFIIDQEGDYHYQGTDGGSYDAYDDIKLARGLRASLSTNVDFRQRFSELIEYAKPIFEKTGVVTYNDDTDGVPFVSGRGMAGFQLDAIYQLGMKVQNLEAEIVQLRNKLQFKETK